MDIYSHELNAYKREIGSLESMLQEFLDDPLRVDNLTSFGLAYSNRINLQVVGLCSLAEVFLFEIASHEEKSHSLKLDSIRGIGITKYRDYLKKIDKINFRLIDDWSKFNNVVKIRNAIIHRYAGLVETSKSDELIPALKTLRMGGSLVANRRLRLTTKDLNQIYLIVEATIGSLRIESEN